jgi:hypothetical protein
MADQRHPAPAVHYAALSALSSISARSRKGAEAAASHGSLHMVVDLLTSHHAKILEIGCQVLANIASHDTLLPAVIEAQPCLHLVALLRFDIQVARLLVHHH